MIQQVEFSLREKRRGFHLVTGEILQYLPQPLPETGLLNLFVKHTSCSLSINENADPDVRTDMEKIIILQKYLTKPQIKLKKSFGAEEIKRIRFLGKFGMN